MAGFDPSEPRVGAGSAAGGQWGGSAKPTKTKGPDGSLVRSTHVSKPKAAKAKAKAKAPAKATPKAPAKHAMGAARNADAAKAQDAAHSAAYDALMGKPAAQRAAYVKGLSDAELEKAAEAAYSFRSTDPDVVRARVALANEAAKRGIDIRKHGALGGGSRPSPKAAPARRAASPAQAHAVAHMKARKAAAKAAPPAPKAAPPSASGGGAFRARAQ
jgi:hypothetical protein